MSKITKYALSQSLKSLLAKKSLNKITINDIAEECGISRMTFYYHFKDIYDLVEWTCVEDGKAVINENKTSDTWQEGMLQIFYSLRDNKPLVMNVYRCIDRENVERYLKPMVDHLLLDVVEEQSENMVVNEENKEFIADVYSYVFVGLLLDWVKTDMKQPPEDIVNKLALVIQDSFSSALERFRLDK